MSDLAGPGGPAAADRLEADRAQARLASLVSSAQDAIITADLDGRIDSWNPAAERLFGYSAAEAIGRPAQFLKPPALRERPNDKVPRLRRGDVVPPSETVRRTKDGRDIEVSIAHSAIRDPAGELIGTSIVARDLTPQRRDEAARFHLAAILAHSGAAIFGADLDNRITSWNAAAQQLYGYAPAEVMGWDSSFVNAPDPDERSAAAREQLRRGEAVAPYDAVHRRKDGTTLDVSVSPSIIRDAAGTVVGYSAFVYDITARKQTERALAEAHEAAVIASREYEAFAYAVAHDLRSPLRGINGFIYLGEQHCLAARPDEARAQFDRARACAEQMSSLIDSLLRLAQVGREPLKRTMVDLSAIAGAVIAQCRDEAPDRVVEVLIQPGLHAIGDADLLGVMLTNLIDNAWKFTRNRPATRPPTRIEFALEGDHYVVRDNGAGFDMDHYEKLFGLFQRLHRPSEFEGNGIGLATSQRIVRRHGGQIWAQAALGEGSTFSFTLALGPQ